MPNHSNSLYNGSRVVIVDDIMTVEKVARKCGFYHRDGSLDVDRAKALMRNAGQIKQGRTAITTKSTLINFVNRRIEWNQRNEDPDGQAVHNSKQPLRRGSRLDVEMKKLQNS